MIAIVVPNITHLANSCTRYNPGIIYETDKGDFALAINKEQHANFEKAGKVLVHLFADRICTIPKVDDTGRRVATLKAVDKLKMIGFSD